MAAIKQAFSAVLPVNVGQLNSRLRKPLATMPAPAAKSTLWGAQLAQPCQSQVSFKCSVLSAVRASQSRRKGSKSKKGAEKPSAPASPPRLEAVAAPAPPPAPVAEPTEKPAAAQPEEAAKVPEAAAEPATVTPSVPLPASTTSGVVELEDLVATKEVPAAAESDDIGKAIADLKRARSERAGEDEGGSSFQKYLEGVLEESREVSWPSPGQVLSQTFIVLMITIVSTVVVSAVNALLGQISASLFQ